MKNKVLIIYTGGTIGTDKSNDGEPPAPKSVRKVLEKMPMLRNPKTPEWELFEVEVPKASEDISLFDYNLIGEIIEQNYQKFGGFVILHGTDTLAYTASALSFSLENLNKPVILTGAQIPLFMPRNDGFNNLMTALTIAAEGKVREVAVCFGNRLLRGNRCTKLTTTNLQAFCSPNFKDLAEIGTKIDYSCLPAKSVPASAFRVQKIREFPMAIFKAFPSVDFSYAEKLLDKNLKALIIEAFGGGATPNLEKGLIPLALKAKKNGTSLVLASQNIGGVITKGKYDPAKRLEKEGVLSSFDMTTETVVAKLNYLLTLDFSGEELKEKFEQNIAGELTV